MVPHLLQFPYGLDTANSTLRTIEAERPRITKLISHEGLRFLDRRLQRFGFLHAEGSPGDRRGLDVELPKADHAAAVEDRVRGEISERFPLYPTPR